jgi:Uncharacterized conserved protein
MRSVVCKACFSCSPTYCLRDEQDGDRGAGRAVLPTSGGCAVFLGNNEKVFIIYVDQTVGSAITMFMRHITKERPLTHDLMAHLLAALGAKVERVIINDLKNATYYARVIIQVENELQQKRSSSWMDDRAIASPWLRSRRRRFT